MILGILIGVAGTLLVLFIIRKLKPVQPPGQAVKVVILPGTPREKS
jgi:hypothetical protein